MKREKFLFITTLLVSLFIVACPKPPEEDDVIVNPYEQHPIDWPSLADSPWPMYKGNPLNNGLSFIEGPTEGVVEWVLDSIGIGGYGISVDSEGNIYFANNNGEVFCCNLDGEILWKKQLVQTVAGESRAPIILADNSIAVFLDKSYFQLDQMGNIIREVIYSNQINSSVVTLDKNGNYYLSFSGELGISSLNNEGNLNLVIDAPDSLEEHVYSGVFPPIFSPDGNFIYTNTRNHVYKFSIAGELIWTYDTNTRSSIISDSFGKIYLWNEADSTFICLTPDGNRDWAFDLGDRDIYEGIAPSITFEGNILIALDGNSLMSLSPTGELNWEIVLPTDGGSVIVSAIVSDINSNIGSVKITGSLFKTSKGI
jgi:hypothetical protein